MSLTIAVVAATLAIVAIFDAYILLVKGRQFTVSVVIYGLSKRYPIIPFLAGIIAGHLFWTQ